MGWARDGWSPACSGRPGHHLSIFGYFFIWMGGVLPGIVWAQAPQIIRFIPGIYRENDLHRIDLYNPTSKPISLEKWLLITRDYSFEFPAGVTISPGQHLTIAKKGGDIQLDRHPNFLIRIPDATQAGHYAVLIEPGGQARIGLYLAPIPQVRFLPDSGLHLSLQSKPISFYVPSETAPVWQYVPWDPDPITGVALIRGKWRYTTANEEKEKLIYAPIHFISLYGEANDTAILLSYEAEVREPCTAYRIERRTADQDWQPIFIQPCPKPGRYKFQYVDTSITAGLQHEYRLSYLGPEGEIITSLPLTIYTEVQRPSFQMQATPGFLRLYVERSQPIKIKLLNAHYEEVLRLYDGWLNGGVENVFTWDPQRYREAYGVVVWTPARRYWQRLGSPP